LASAKVGIVVAVKLLDFLAGLSGALDLMSPEVVGHHKRVAFASVRLGQCLGLSRHELTDLYMAALLHDVGGFTLISRLQALQFEADGTRHAEYGYRLLRHNPLLGSVALLVRHHHTPCALFGGLEADERSLFLANVLNLADRLDVLYIRYGMTDTAALLQRLSQRVGTQFLPELIAALGELMGDETFWLGLTGPAPLALLNEEENLFEQRGLSRGQLLLAARSFSQLIDFRSRFTATHSCGVAETAVHLGRLSGMCDKDLDVLRLAGSLHDLGKLAVPGEILDKPGPLDAAELMQMRRHPELTSSILSQVPGLEVVNTWASQHHEHLSGQGYPWGVAGNSLSLGSRVLAVADVFTALREDRPYRAGLSSTDSLRLMRKLAGEGHLDEEVVVLLSGNQRAINARRRETQTRANAEFREFYSGLPE